MATREWNLTGVSSPVIPQRVFMEDAVERFPAAVHGIHCCLPSPQGSSRSNPCSPSTCRNSPPIPGIGLQVSLKRERLELSPVYATAVAHGGHKLGYIRLVNFGAHAAADMGKAMDRLEAQGVEGYILGARRAVHPGFQGLCARRAGFSRLAPPRGLACRRMLVQSHVCLGRPVHT